MIKLHNTIIYSLWVWHDTGCAGGVRCGVKSGRRKSFMESGGQSIQPMSTGFFPRPKQGQSLASFLSSGQFAGARAELDRENAHFAISEAMISAVEQVSSPPRDLLHD